MKFFVNIDQIFHTGSTVSRHITLFWTSAKFHNCIFPLLHLNWKPPGSFLASVGLCLLLRKTALWLLTWWACPCRETAPLPCQWSQAERTAHPFQWVGSLAQWLCPGHPRSWQTHEQHNFSALIHFRSMFASGFTVCVYYSKYVYTY